MGPLAEAPVELKQQRLEVAAEVLPVDVPAGWHTILQKPKGGRFQARGPAHGDCSKLGKHARAHGSNAGARREPSRVRGAQVPGSVTDSLCAPGIV